MTVNAVQPSKAKPVLFSLLTLLSGIVIGAGATLIFIGLPPKEQDMPLPEEFSRRMVERLTHELALTPEQRESIGPVIERHMKALDTIREEARPKIRLELEAMNNEILAMLDERQQQMWKDQIERMQRRFREFRDRRGPGGSGDGPRRREGDSREGDWRGRDRDDRDPDDRSRFRRGDGPGWDPNSPFFRRQRPGGDMPDFLLPPPTQDEELTPEG